MIARLSPLSHEKVHATLLAPVINDPAAISPNLSEVTSLNVFCKKSCLSHEMARLAPASKMIGVNTLFARFTCKSVDLVSSKPAFKDTVGDQALHY